MSEKDINLQKDFVETAFNYIQGDEYGTFFTADTAWKKKIRDWKKRFPDDVKILTKGKTRDMIAELPVSWLRFSPPRTMSDEFKAAQSKRMSKLWEERKEQEQNG